MGHFKELRLILQYIDNPERVPKENATSAWECRPQLLL